MKMDMPDRIWAGLIDIGTEGIRIRGWAESQTTDEVNTEYLRSTPERERVGEHIEHLESLLLRIIQKHDRTIRSSQEALGFGFVQEVPEVVEAREYLDSIAAEEQKGN